jgi:hypothetical protein
MLNFCFAVLEKARIAPGVLGEYQLLGRSVLPVKGNGGREMEDFETQRPTHSISFLYFLPLVYHVCADHLLGSVSRHLLPITLAHTISGFGGQSPEP